MIPQAPGTLHVFQGPDNGLRLIKAERIPNKTLTAQPFQDTPENYIKFQDDPGLSHITKDTFSVSYG